MVVSSSDRTLRTPPEFPSCRPSSRCTRRTAIRVVPRISREEGSRISESSPESGDTRGVNESTGHAEQHAEFTAANGRAPNVAPCPVFVATGYAGATRRAPTGATCIPQSQSRPPVLPQGTVTLGRSYSRPPVSPVRPARSPTIHLAYSVRFSYLRSLLACAQRPAPPGGSTQELSTQRYPPSHDSHLRQPAAGRRTTAKNCAAAEPPH
jgi:hypothetical protein